jgi:hypothetical protein
VKQKEQKLADQLAIHLDGKPAAGKTAQTQTPTEKSMTALSPPAQSQRRSSSRIRSAPTSTTTLGMGPGSARPPSPAMTSSLAPSRSQQQTETARSRQQHQQQNTTNSHRRELAEMEQRELRFREENQALSKRLRRVGREGKETNILLCQKNEKRQIHQQNLCLSMTFSFLLSLIDLYFFF